MSLIHQTPTDNRHTLTNERRCAPGAAASDSPGERAAAQGRLRIAYIMSRFPKITETFVLYELLAVEQTRCPVEVYPLLRERSEVAHPEAASVVERAHYDPFWSRRIAKANLHFLRRKPGAYLKALGALMRGTWGSLNFFAGGLAIFPKVVAFAYSMERQGVGHVHAHFCNHPAAAAFVIHRLTGIPYSFTAHGSDLHRDRHMLREKVREAAFVVAISNYNREVIVSECGPAARDKIAVIHCGVDTSVFHPRENEAEASSRGVLNVVCVGTLHEVKGQAYLIDACRLLHEQGIRVVCHLVGDGPDRASLVEQVKSAGLADAVQLHGVCTRAQVVALLSRADVVAAPSAPTADGRREGIPVALMEAMACGVPVVASELSGIPELIEHEQSGLLTPPRDAQAVAAALTRLHRDASLRRRLGAAGKEIIQRRFNLRANAEQLANMFRSAAQREQTRHALPTEEPK